MRGMWETLNTLRREVATIGLLVVIIWLLVDKERKRNELRKTLRRMQQGFERGT